MRRVMVVDDDDGVRACISDMLREEGLHVVEACDGEEALRLMHAGPRPSLVITDGRMPCLSGYGLRAAMLEDDGLADIPVLLVSATPDAERARHVGITARLDKPFGLEKLVGVVRALLGRLSATSRCGATLT